MSAERWVVAPFVEFDERVGREVSAVDARARGFVLGPAQATAPTATLEPLGQPRKRKDVQHSAFLAPDGVWVRAVSFIPGLPGHEWRPVIGFTSQVPQEEE